MPSLRYTLQQNCRPSAVLCCRPQLPRVAGVTHSVSHSVLTHTMITRSCDAMHVLATRDPVECTHRVYAAVLESCRSSATSALCSQTCCGIRGRPVYRRGVLRSHAGWHPPGRGAVPLFERTAPRKAPRASRRSSRIHSARFRSPAPRKSQPQGASPWSSGRPVRREGPQSGYNRCSGYSGYGKPAYASSELTA